MEGLQDYPADDFALTCAINVYFNGIDDIDQLPMNDTVKNLLRQYKIEKWNFKGDKHIELIKKILETKRIWLRGDRVKRGDSIRYRFCVFGNDGRICEGTDFNVEVIHLDCCVGCLMFKIDDVKIQVPLFLEDGVLGKFFIRNVSLKDCHILSKQFDDFLRAFDYMRALLERSLENFGHGVPLNRNEISEIVMKLLFSISGICTFASLEFMTHFFSYGLVPRTVFKLFNSKSISPSSPLLSYILFNESFQFIIQYRKDFMKNVISFLSEIIVSSVELNFMWEEVLNFLSWREILEFTHYVRIQESNYRNMEGNLVEIGLQMRFDFLWGAKSTQEILCSLKQSPRILVVCDSDFWVTSRVIPQILASSKDALFQFINCISISDGHDSRQNSHYELKSFEQSIESSVPYSGGENLYRISASANFQLICDYILRSAGSGFSKGHHSKKRKRKETLDQWLLVGFLRRFNPGGLIGSREKVLLQRCFKKIQIEYNVDECIIHQEFLRQLQFPTFSKVQPRCEYPEIFEHQCDIQNGLFVIGGQTMLCKNAMDVVRTKSFNILRVHIIS